jgi:hypothetical protein
MSADARAVFCPGGAAFVRAEFFSGFGDTGTPRMGTFLSGHGFF